ncbi:MAG: response regulator transcription factor [Opitutaceae bacterium]|nr:response regulator transcription factor [Opitutaceae bacterium]
MTDSPVRVVLIDDHQLFRKGLRLLLEQTPTIKVIGEAGTVAAAVALALETQPDVIVADIHLPDGDGIVAAEQMKRDCPRASIIFLSSDSDFRLVRRALDAGGRGYLLKDAAPQDIVRAIEAAEKGDVYLCPEVAAALVKDYQQRDGTAAPPPRLSEREREVLRLVANGLRNKEVAARLDVSVKSVETYRRRLMNKLGYTSTAELVRHALREGLIAP